MRFLWADVALAACADSVCNDRKQEPLSRVCVCVCDLSLTLLNRMDLSLCSQALAAYLDRELQACTLSSHQAWEAPPPRMFGSVSASDLFLRGVQLLL